MGDLTRVQTSQPVQLVDANDLQVADITTVSPLGTESGLIVRNIPSGTQAVSGTLTATPSGTYTVAGTVVASPTGTQAVSGLVTASPTGTYTVAGTTTAVPSGTQNVAGTITAAPSGTYTMTGAGSAGTADAGVVTVQGIVNGVSMPVAIDDASRKSKGTNTFTRVQPTTTATQLVATNSNRITLLIYNAGTETVYLNRSSSVSTTNGVPLLPQSNLEDGESLDAWYGITGQNTGDLRIIETTI